MVWGQKVCSPYLVPPHNSANLVYSFLLLKKLTMKKPYVPVPVEELTDEELKRWFQRLRELYQWEQHHVHEVKIERWKLRVEVDKLKKEIRILTRDIRLQKEEYEKIIAKLNKQLNDKKPIEKKKEEPVNDFKKKFLDSL